MLKKIDKRLVAFILGGGIIANTCSGMSYVSAYSYSRKYENSSSIDLSDLEEDVPNNHSWFRFYSDAEIKKGRDSVLSEIKKCESDLNKVSNCEFVENCKDALKEIKPGLSEKFFFGRNQLHHYDKLRAITKELNKVILKVLDSEKKELELSEEEKKKKAEEILKSQNEYFNNRKEELISSVDTIVKQINRCFENFSEAESFSEIADELKRKAGDISKSIKSKEIRNEIRSNDVNTFEKNVDKLLEDVSEMVNEWRGETSSFFERISEVKKQLKDQLIAEAKEELFAKMDEFEKEAEEDFVPAEVLEDKDIKNVENLKNDLLNSLESLRKLVNKMDSFEKKNSIEKEFNILKQTKVRSLSRKKKIEERANEKNVREELLSSKQDFNKQLVLLRNKKIKLNQVVGGYQFVLDKLDSLVKSHEVRLKTGKGTPPKGIVLHGEAGTGKTTTVEAWAAAHNYNLIMLKRGTDMIDMVSEIHAKFSDAKRLATEDKLSIILVDEIDAIGTIRKPGATDKETVALMGEIDALKADSGVVVVATTNLLDAVDKAVVRSGRLEQSCKVSRPTDSDVSLIAKVCLEGFRLENSMTLDEFVSNFSGDLREKTGADIRRIIETAISNNMEKNKLEFFRDVNLKVRDVKEAIESRNC